MRLPRLLVLRRIALRCSSFPIAPGASISTVQHSLAFLAVPVIARSVKYCLSVEDSVMPKLKRRRMPFYLRDEPKPQHDIRLLRPRSLPLGQRFEASEDVHNYSQDSEEKLGLSDCREDRRLADDLSECRTSDRNCGLPSCPICARLFRIWFVGELLRIIEKVGSAQVRIETILLDQAPYDQIDTLDIKGYDALLRKRLSRNGLADVAIIGGYENVYRAQSKSWMLHLNLVIIGGKVEAMRAFENTFSKSPLQKPTMLQTLEDLKRQLSYILKFVTYHRPFAQLGSTKSTPVPLNQREHRALVSWMAQWRFQDFMFLFNARREGARIVSRAGSRLTF
jgi:hypothetical protein